MSDLIERIDAAICRIANGDGPMRVPAEDTDPDMVLAECRKEIERLRAKLAASEAACAPFLKDGETPAECIARWRSEAVAVLELLRQERVRSEKAEAELAARPTQWAYEQACNARNSRAERAEAECARLREALTAIDTACTTQLARHGADRNHLIEPYQAGFQSANGTVAAAARIAVAALGIDMKPKEPKP